MIQNAALLRRHSTLVLLLHHDLDSDAQRANVPGRWVGRHTRVGVRMYRRLVRPSSKCTPDLYLCDACRCRQRHLGAARLGWCLGLLRAAGVAAPAPAARPLRTPPTCTARTGIKSPVATCFYPSPRTHHEHATRRPLTHSPAASLVLPFRATPPPAARGRRAALPRRGWRPGH
jgi:hypothetical protein